MKFGLYLSTHSRDIWRAQYINYKAMKKLVKDVVESTEHAVYIPTQLSLSTDNFIGMTGGMVPASHLARLGGPTPTTHDKAASDMTPQEHFFMALEKEVQRIDSFTKNAATELRGKLSVLHLHLQQKQSELMSDPAVREALMEQARELSNEYLHLEKFVNLNYAGLQKILKKHDKLLPNAPCFAFYMAHISTQPWVRGDHHDLQVTLTRIFGVLHRAHGLVDTQLVEHSHEECTRRFWVNADDLVQVKHMFLQHLPASDLPQHESEDYSLVNHLFLDNSSLELYHNFLYGRPYSTLVQVRWRGLGNPATVQFQRKIHKEGWRPEVAIKDSFPLEESKVADFLQGRWTFADARKYLLQQQDAQRSAQMHLSASSSTFDADGNLHVIPAQSEAERLAEEYSLFKTFTEVQRLVESKSLQPMVRVVHRETVFEEAKVPGLAGRLKVEIEEEIEAFLEYSYDGMYRLSNGLWRQEQPADRILLPYALIHVHAPVVKGCEPSHAEPPAWLAQLIKDGLLREVHDFSKMQFAVAGLMPDMVRAVPVWIDDPAIQKALYANVLGRDQMYGRASSAMATTAAELARTSTLSELERRSSELVMIGAPGSSNGPPHGTSLAEPSGKPHGGAGAVGVTALAVSRNGSGKRWSLSGAFASATGKQQQQAGGVAGVGLAGWQAKLVERARGQGYVYQQQVVFEEPEHYTLNERMLLNLLRLAILVGGLAVIMLGFAAKSYSDPTQDPSIHISELTAFVLLFCAICICAYGIGAFLWRGSRMYQLRAPRYDDTVGTLCLNFILTCALTALLAINIADLVEDGNDGWF